jgi:hypothetical protein
VSAAAWPEHWIVVGQSCVGTDPVFRGSSEVATHFACMMNVYVRPASVSRARWEAMGAAFRSHDIAKVYALLGVPAGSSASVVAAAARKWGLGDAHPVMVGVAVHSTSRWSRTPSAISPRTFDAALMARKELLGAIPSVEAYYADHHSYAGMTTSKLRTIDANLIGTLRIVSATKTRYCVQVGPPTWFEHGPGAAPTFGRC